MPVNTVSRRLGISTLMSLRLFTRAPCTRIRSWLSAVCCVVVSVCVLIALNSKGRRSPEEQREHAPDLVRAPRDGRPEPHPDDAFALAPEFLHDRHGAFVGLGGGEPQP